MTWAHNTASLGPCIVFILRASFCLRIEWKPEVGALEFWIIYPYKIRDEDLVMLVMWSSDLDRGFLKTNIMLWKVLH